MTESVELIPDTGGPAIGSIDLSRNADSGQITIIRINVKDPNANKEEFSKCISIFLDSEFEGDYRSASSYPKFDDTLSCSILIDAGFSREGVFMGRDLLERDDQIQFRELDKEELSRYLLKHSEALAKIIASKTGHDQSKVAKSLYDENRGTFSSGSIIRNEAILRITNVADIGYIWISVHAEGDLVAAFIEEFEIFQDQRRKGLGSAAINAIGNSTFPFQVRKITLFVQPENVPAWNLYRKLNFTPGNCEMVKYKPSNKSLQGTA